MKVLNFILPFIVFILGLNTIAFSQKMCNMDQRHQQKLLDPEYRKKFEETRNQLLRNKIN